MNYRILGKTGLQVSTLGFGCMRFPVVNKDHTRIDEAHATQMIHLAIDQGVNYFDTAYPYHSDNFSRPGSSEPFLAKALKNGYREKVYVATKLPCWLAESRKDLDRLLEEQLARLETDCIDLYLLHALNRKTWDKMLGFGVLDFLESALKAGKIRFAGFSYHDELPLFKEIVDAYDWSFCQIMYNYFDEHFQAGREGLDYAVERNMGVVAMEPLRGGALVNGLPEESRTILKEAEPGRSEVEWAFRWLWKQSGVTVALSGMSHLDQVKENLALANAVSTAGWTHKDARAIEKAREIIFKLQRVNCTSCGYCLPCPEGVNIPRNFSLCNDHHMLHDPAAKNRYFGLLSEAERASNCVQCGICEEQCPQHIAIQAELGHVVDLFES
jgi:predicted aldo/keto reductase-like oxidoreductase